MTSGGSAWMTTLVNLSTEWKTKLLRHTTMAQANGPFASTNATRKATADVGSSQRYASVTPLVK